MFILGQQIVDSETDGPVGDREEQGDCRESVAGAATDDTSHVLLRGNRDSQHKPQSESFVISQPLGFSPNQT